jgi:hypothetical protein
VLDQPSLFLQQAKASGCKVSDESTVSIARIHRQRLHRHGIEKDWWTSMQIAPLDAAKRLLAVSLIPKRRCGDASQSWLNPWLP